MLSFLNERILIVLLKLYGGYMMVIKENKNEGTEVLKLFYIV